MKFTRISSGYYATPDGTYAVVKDVTGYVSAEETDRTGEANDGWCLAHDPQGRLREDQNAGDNVDWFDTKRDAVNAARSEMERKGK